MGRPCHQDGRQVESRCGRQASSLGDGTPRRTAVPSRFATVPYTLPATCPAAPARPPVGAFSTCSKAPTSSRCGCVARSLSKSRDPSRGHNIAWLRDTVSRAALRRCGLTNREQGPRRMRLGSSQLRCSLTYFFASLAVFGPLFSRGTMRHLDAFFSGLWSGRITAERASFPVLLAFAMGGVAAAMTLRRPMAASRSRSAKLTRRRWPLASTATMPARPIATPLPAHPPEFCQHGAVKKAAGAALSTDNFWCA
jgi:hypothetical protein